VWLYTARICPTGGMVQLGLALTHYRSFWVRLCESHDPTNSVMALKDKD